MSADDGVVSSGAMSEHVHADAAIAEPETGPAVGA
jgi:hypothetical protein